VKLYRTASSCFLEDQNRCFSLTDARGDDAWWDSLITREDLYEYLLRGIEARVWQEEARANFGDDLRAPIGTQEVWAAGVTYYRSREARMRESEQSGGGSFYDRVYDAARPELFFKATSSRVVGPGGKVAIRDDSSWSVPEPELTLLVSPRGKITGYTVGNDMSSRSIEGENPLYLPQAKVYHRCCALGPCILVNRDPLPKSTEISMEIMRANQREFTGATLLSSMKRDPPTLVEYLYRNNTFPTGCYLLTGTGIVPSEGFTLKVGDQIRISIAGIGTLTNTVG
jgi:2-dehydro-3-deoxy-D-arabinonate dehydratase